MRRLVPKGHGICRGFLECYSRFRPKRWKRLFEAGGFEVHKVEPLLLYGPSECPIVPTSSLLNKVRICSSVAFLMTARRDDSSS